MDYDQPDMRTFNFLGHLTVHNSNFGGLQVCSVTHKPGLLINTNRANLRATIISCICHYNNLLEIICHHTAGSFIYYLYISEMQQYDDKLIAAGYY